MPCIQVVEPIDGFSFEQAGVDVPARAAAVREVENVVLVQDDGCEHVVTLTRNALTLWDPEVCFGDHPHRAVTGDLAEAVAAAEAWLSAYLGVGPENITRLLDPDDFDDQAGTSDVQTEGARG